MATFGVLNDLAKGNIFYEDGLKPEFSKIGKSRLWEIANFLKHADRDPEAILANFDPADNDWRIGFCLLLYRSTKRDTHANDGSLSFLDDDSASG